MYLGAIKAKTSMDKVKQRGKHSGRLLQWEKENRIQSEHNSSETKDGRAFEELK